MTATQSTAPSLALLRERRQKLLALFHKHGAFNVRVFGSVARGEAHLSSDIDFLCDQDRARRTPWYPMGLIADLEAELGYSVDVVGPEKLRVPLLGDNIKADLVAL